MSFVSIDGENVSIKEPWFTNEAREHIEVFNESYLLELSSIYKGESIEKTLLYEVLITRDHIEEQLGVEAKYYFSDGTLINRRERSLSISWGIWSDDLSLPMKYVWETSLHVKYPGVHTFEFKGDGSVTINALNPFVEGVESASMALGIGLHKIRVEAYPLIINWDIYWCIYRDDNNCN